MSPFSRKRRGMKKAILNADDFGLCRPVNEGIVRAHREGILTSATLMTTTPGFDEAVGLAKDNPRLGVGVHLNLVRGRPLSRPEDIPGLLGADGRFLGRPLRVLRRVVSGRISAGELERELRAQVEKALASGLALTHLDSEKHLHAFPPVFRTVLKVARAYGFRRVRFIRECRLSRHPVQSLKAAFLSACSARMRTELRAEGFVNPGAFYGISNSGRMTVPALRRILERLGEGTSEIMVHPGFETPELFEAENEVGRYYINRFRERELRTLLDPVFPPLVRRLGVELVDFRGIG
ncbi:MAG: ChbG/HpnK family deacetylase [Candidatus Aminicenantes bacterium]|nr:ChbG/HpnK family deacetylase [Candidatus Aminicenantes bacterium]